MANPRKRQRASLAVLALFAWTLSPPLTAADLRSALVALSEEHDFTIKGLDTLGTASASPTSGPLRERLATLLKRFNHVLEGTPPNVERVIILGAKTAATNAFAVPTTRRGSQHIVRATLTGDRGRDRKLALMVDTGASTIVLPSSMIATLGFKERELPERLSRTANGPVTGRVARLTRVTVGGAVATDVEVLFIDDAALGDIHLLGMSFLDNFAVTLDESSNRLLLAPR